MINTNEKLAKLSHYLSIQNMYPDNYKELKVYHRYNLDTTIRFMDDKTKMEDIHELFEDLQKKFGSDIVDHHGIGEDLLIIDGCDPLTDVSNKERA